MLAIEKLSSSEHGFTSYEKNIVITLRFENIAQCCDTREKVFLRVHFIHSTVFVKHLCFKAYLQRQTAALSEHTSHGKGRSGKYMTAVQLLR